MEKYIYDTLYYYKEDDEEGYDLFNVQLLEHKDDKRIDALKNILNNEDKFIAYQAMLILVAWGIEEGFVTLNTFLKDKWYLEFEFEPHRLYNEDNVLDTIADALDIAWFSSYNKKIITEKIQLILSLYGIMFFEGKLKNILLKRDELTKNILQDVKAAFESAFEQKRYYQASQLYPVIHKHDITYAKKIRPKLEALTIIDKRIAFNLDEVNLGSID